MSSPEELAREKIDKLLTDCGWILQNRSTINLSASRGVAIREALLKDRDEVDYLLFVDGKAIGTVEAKPEGYTLIGVEEQSGKYGKGLLDIYPKWREPLPFAYESTGVETQFTNQLDPSPKSRNVFAFHKPETLLEYLEPNANLNTRLTNLPTSDQMPKSNLWSAQIEAIRNLEKSLAANKRCALIQMATGSGKTYTAVNFVYRLIELAGARRVLFLVDRGNLGDQTLKEFQQFVTPDDGRKFTELYNVQHLQSAQLDRVSRVCISTIQRLYSMLRGEEIDPEIDERSGYELRESLWKQPPPVVYNPNVPIETFDFIITDECHRSIYNLWRQVLEYFDAYRVNSRELVGKAAPIPEGLEPCVFESKNIRLRLNRELANPKFIGFTLALYGQIHFNRNAQQVVGMASISQPQVAALEIPLPPLGEQTRIVAETEAKLSVVEELAVVVAAQLQRAARLRQSILQRAFDGGLTASS